MKVVGLEANVGSMLYPFLEAGHNIACNYDSRKIVKEDNYLTNFPYSELCDDLDDWVKLAEGADIIVSQPSCSKFSQLSRRDLDDYSSDDSVDLAYYIDKIKPKLVFIESKIDYIYEMPLVDGYKYQLEWVSNHHYGNTQATRNRLWVMLIREDFDWEFVPNEKMHTMTVETLISDLPDVDIPQIDHVHKYKPFLKNSITREYLTLDEAFDMLKKDGKLSYIAADGSTKNRINRRIAKPVLSTTITGGGTYFHWRKKYPLTVREKARIQGFPDEFSFKGLSNTGKDKAVGKSMPMEFTRYLVSIIDNPIKGEKGSKMVPEPAKLSMFKRLNKDILVK